ncbi:MAG: exopolysaccharide biosynthesis protein [Rubrivivax sp.]
MQPLRPEVFLDAAAGCSRLSLAELLRLHGEDSAAVVLLVVSVLCVVPIYGMGTALSFAIFAMAWHWRQVARSGGPRDGRTEGAASGPRWLPERVARATLDETWSRRCLHGLAWLYSQAGRRLRERLPACSDLGTRPLWAVWIALQGFVIFLPLPFGNVLPAISLVLLCLGWMFRDGLALLGSALVGAIALAYTWAFGHLVWVLVDRLWGVAGRVVG